MKRVETLLYKELGKKANAIKAKVGDYLIECLDGEDPERFDGKTLRHIYVTALFEKRHEVERVGEKEAIKDWLQGLGMSVDYTYYDIANRMRSWGYEVSENNEDDYYEKCDLYWDILTQVIYEGAMWWADFPKLMKKGE